MSNNKQQTAVEYFAKEIFYTIELLKKGYVNDQDLLNTIIVISDKAKSMHKEECIKYYVDSTDYGNMGQHIRESLIQIAEKIYNETFGGNNDQEQNC